MKSAILSVTAAIFGLALASPSFAAPAAGKPIVIPFVYPKLYPEGIEFDAAKNRFLAGSLVSGDIIEISPTGGPATRIISNPNVNGTVGIHLDENRQLHTAVFGIGRFIGYTRYDLERGNNTFINLNFLYAYPAGPRGHGVNDVTTDGKGNVYLTDTFGNLLVKIDRHDTASVIAGTDGVFNTTTLPPLSPFSSNYGINGIAFVKSCNVVLTGTLGTGELFTVTPAGNVTRVQTPRQVSVDGLSMIDDRHAVTTSAVPHSQAVYWKSTDCWKTAKVTKTVDLATSVNGADPDVSTNVVVGRKTVAVLGAHINEYNAAPGNGTRQDYQVILI
ncbi:hypothetical protein DFJ77DRAFT_510627 [Powellomyces hirtus]|nr:hypothetical protein DFJ77DRAFT_510627 [Powellomyces hirtus]